MCDRPARTWRANGGYQDVCACPQKLTMPQKMKCYPTVPPWAMPQRPPGYVTGPVPIAGLFTGYPGYPQQATAAMPPPPSYLECFPAQAPAPAPAVKIAPPAPPKIARNEPPRRKKRNPWAPPELDAKNGEQYMFDRAENHTKVHVFNKAAPVWMGKYENVDL